MHISDGKIFLRQAQFKVLNIGQHNVYDYLKENTRRTRSKNKSLGVALCISFLPYSLAFGSTSCSEKTSGEWFTVGVPV